MQDLTSFRVFSTNHTENTNDQSFVADCFRTLSTFGLCGRIRANPNCRNNWYPSYRSGSKHLCGVCRQGKHHEGTRGGSGLFLQEQALGSGSNNGCRDLPGEAGGSSTWCISHFHVNLLGRLRFSCYQLLAVLYMQSGCSEIESAGQGHKRRPRSALEIQPSPTTVSRRTNKKMVEAYEYKT